MSNLFLLFYGAAVAHETLIHFHLYRPTDRPNQTQKEKKNICHKLKRSQQIHATHRIAHIFTYRLQKYITFIAQNVVWHMWKILKSSFSLSHHKSSETSKNKLYFNMRCVHSSNIVEKRKVIITTKPKFKSQIIFMTG